jgi:hypothetical protein
VAPNQLRLAAATLAWHISGQPNLEQSDALLLPL